MYEQNRNINKIWKIEREIRRKSKAKNIRNEKTHLGFKNRFEQADVGQELRMA